MGRVWGWGGVVFNCDKVVSAPAVQGGSERVHISRSSIAGT